MVWSIASAASPVPETLDYFDSSSPVTVETHIKIQFRNPASFWSFAYFTTGRLDHHTILRPGFQAREYNALVDKSMSVNYPPIANFV